jgi:hypothetical protein
MRLYSSQPWKKFMEGYNIFPCTCPERLPDV